MSGFQKHPENLGYLRHSFENMFFKLLKTDTYPIEDFCKDWKKYEEYAKNQHLKEGVDVTDMSIWLRFTSNDCYTFQNVLRDLERGGTNKDFLIEKVEDCISLKHSNEIEVYYS